MTVLGLTNKVWVLDTETSSKVNLKLHGADRYFADRSTRTLMLGYRELGSSDTHLHQPHREALPQVLLDAAALPPEELLFCAFNAPFDRQALALLGLHTPMEKWLELQLLAYTLGFSGRLDDVLKQFNVCDPQGNPLRKSAEGTRLITRFSVQRAPWFEHPTEWDAFIGYCRQDVDVEVALLERCITVLDQFPDQNRTLRRQWLMDQRMNARGLPVSRATVEGALKIKAIETARILDDMKAITGLANPNSVPQLMDWCKAQGHPMTDLQAPTIRDVLTQPHVPPQIKTVLQHRVEVGKSSVKKFGAIAAMQVGWRVRNGYTTAGASRTGRTASRGINLSNLERPKLKDPDWAADLIELGDPALLEMWLYGPDAGKPIMDVLGSCVRGAIAAPEGKGLTAVDLKSIESVGVAWLAGCDTILNLFWEGKDTYKDFATKHYKIPYEAVTKEQRTFCKAPCLGCGYGAAGSALVDYAAGMGITLSEDEADAMVSTFRTEFWEIPLLWSNLEQAAKQAILRPGETFKAFACAGQSPYGPLYKAWPYISYYYDRTFLYCGLPSGRTLFYYQPKILPRTIRSKRTGQSYRVSSIHYWGKRQETGGGWDFISTWAGMLLENNTQALCRDVFYHGVELLEGKPDIEVDATLYDEVVAETPFGEAARPAYETIIQCMTTPAPWMDDRFYLGAEGYYGVKRYRK